MSQNPNGNPNYNPYGPNPSNPNYPAQPPGTAYGGSQQPSGPNSGNISYPGNNPTYQGNPNTPSYPASGPPSGPGVNTPNSSYGGYNNPYAPPPPPTGGTGPNPYDPYAPTMMSQQNSSPGYAPYNPPSGPQPGGMMLPPNPMPNQQQQRKGRGPVVIISLIALLIIAGGIIAFVLYNNNVSNQNTLHANATGTAQAQGNVSATATQSSQNSGATATATAHTYPFSNNVVLKDPLADNTKGYNWDNDGKACAFSGNAYHITDKDTNTYEPCFANNTNFANFTFQVEMVINQGDGNTLAGLIFRANVNSNKLYRLVFDDQGDCLLLLSVDTTGTHTRDLKDCQATQFNTGLGVTNTVGVVADNDQISIYVNQQLVVSVNDPTYSHGQIGLEVENQDSSVSEAIFSNAEVWQLPS